MEFEIFFRAASSTPSNKLFRMFQGAEQNEESLLPPGEGQDEGIINGRLHDPLTPTLSLREREPSGKYPEKLVCRTSLRPMRRCPVSAARTIRAACLLFACLASTALRAEEIRSAASAATAEQHAGADAPRTQW